MRSDILNANSQQSGGYKLKATNLVSDTTLTEADSGKVFFITLCPKAPWLLSKL